MTQSIFVAKLNNKTFNKKNKLNLSDYLHFTDFNKILFIEEILQRHYNDGLLAGFLWRYRTICLRI